MTMWEWGLFVGAAVIALQILTSLMSYYHQLYRHEYLTEYLRRQQQKPPSPAVLADTESQQSQVPKPPVTPTASDQTRVRNAA